MRVVIQRVSKASVTIDGTLEGVIGKGLLILLGIEDRDTETDVDWLVGKISQLRIFPDQDGKMNLSLVDMEGEALVVSQFTLFASTKKGNRPGFTRSSRPDTAIPLYEAFKTALAARLSRPIASGTFGADMQVSLVNDGPVTITIDSHARE